MATFTNALLSSFGSPLSVSPTLRNLTPLDQLGATPFPSGGVYRISDLASVFPQGRTANPTAAPGSFYTLGQIAQMHPYQKPQPSDQPPSVSTPASTPSSASSSSGYTLGYAEPGVDHWKPQIEAASKATGTPDWVIAAIMTNESHGDQTAQSDAGALGLMQVMPFHFTSGQNGMDPQTNITTGAQILQDNYQHALKNGLSGDNAWTAAVSAYLGDWNWNTNSFAGQADSYGTDGPAYTQKFWNVAKQIRTPVSQPTSSNASLSGSGSVETAIGAGSKLKGQAYVFGGNDPTTGLDCSSFTQYSYKQAGVNLPRTAQEQYDATTRVSAPQRGDLVFFTGTYDAGEPVTHVGIYLGNGQMLDDQNNGVVVDNLSDPYWQSHLYGYGRVQQ